MLREKILAVHRANRAVKLLRKEGFGLTNANEIAQQIEDNATAIILPAIQSSEPIEILHNAGSLNGLANRLGIKRKSAEKPGRFKEYRPPVAIPID